MTALEKKIRKHTKGLYNFSPVCVGQYGELECLNFSKIPCESCGSKLFGARYVCSATKGKAHTNKHIRLEICADCFEWFFT